MKIVLSRYFDERVAIRSGIISGVVGFIFGGPIAGLLAAGVSGAVNGFLSDPLDRFLVREGVPSAGTAGDASTEAIENIV